MAPVTFDADESGVILERPVVRRSARETSPARTSAFPLKETEVARPTAKVTSRPAAPARVHGAGEARRIGRALPWLVVVAVLGVGTGGSLWGWQRYALTVDQRAAAEEEARALGDKVSRLESEALAVGVRLRRTQAELATATATAGAGAESPGRLEELETIERRMRKVVTADRGEVARDHDRVSLRLVDDLLFQAGTAALTDGGRIALLELGEALNQVPDRQIWVEGHTDDTPLERTGGAGFASSWELSAARALAVLDYLERDALVDPRRLAAVAFGQHRPRSTSRARNRRIEVVLAPASAPLEARGARAALR